MAELIIHAWQPAVHRVHLHNMIRVLRVSPNSHLWAIRAFSQLKRPLEDLDDHPMYQKMWQPLNQEVARVKVPVPGQTGPLPRFRNLWFQVLSGALFWECYAPPSPTSIYAIEKKIALFSEEMIIIQLSISQDDMFPSMDDESAVRDYLFEGDLRHIFDWNYRPLLLRLIVLMRSALSDCSPIQLYDDLNRWPSTPPGRQRLNFKSLNLHALGEIVGSISLICRIILRWSLSCSSCMFSKFRLSTLTIIECTVIMRGSLFCRNFTMDLTLQLTPEALVSRMYVGSLSTERQVFIGDTRTLTCNRFQFVPSSTTISSILSGAL